MNNKKIHIDELFRRGLSGMQMPVDGSDWAAMQATLAAAQKRRKRRVIIFFWLLGLGILAGGAIGVYSLNSKPQILNSKKENTVIAQNDKPTNSLSDSKTENTAQIADSKAITKSNDATDAKQHVTPAQPSVNPVSKKELKPDRKNNFTQKGNSQDNPEKGDAAENDAGKQAIENTEEGENTGNNEQGNTPVEPSKTIDRQDEKSVPALPVTADSLPKDETPVADTKEQEKQENNSKTNRWWKIENPAPFSIGIAAGPVANTFGTGNSNYGKIRKNGDKMGLGYNAAVIFNYQPGNLALSGGLGYSSIESSGQYRYMKQISDSFPVLNPWGDTITFVHHNFRDTSLNYALQSRFNYITLPLSLSYSLKLGENSKSGIKISAGIQVQRLVAVNGDYINPFNLYKMDLTMKDDFIRKWNMNANISVGYYYQINDKFTLDLSMIYSHAGNMLGKGVNAAVRPRSMGVTAGIKYNFIK